VVRGIFAKPCDTAIRSREDPVSVAVVVRFNRVPREERVFSLLKRERLPTRYVRDFFEEKEQSIVFED